jgi:hypothetical protein
MRGTVRIDEHINSLIRSLFLEEGLLTTTGRVSGVNNTSVLSVFATYHEVARFSVSVTLFSGSSQNISRNHIC